MSAMGVRARARRLSARALTPALDLAPHAARRRPAAGAALGGADPARAGDEAGGAHGGGRRPGPPWRGPRECARVRAVRRAAGAGAAARLRSAVQGASWHYHVVRCAGLRLPVPPPGHPPRAARRAVRGREATRKFLGGKYTRKRPRRYGVDDGRRSARCSPTATGRRLLDFGCGDGLFLESPTARLRVATASTSPPDAIEVARKQPGRRERATSARPREVPEIAAGGFDVITMWSVLAHLAEPVEDLTMLRGAARPRRRPARADGQRRIR